MNTDKMFTFDRWDFLATRILLVGIAMGTALLLVCRPLWDWASGSPLVWSVNLDVDGLSTPAVAAQPGTGLAWDGTAKVTIPEPTTSVWIATLMPSVLMAITVIAVIVLIYRLMARIQRGEPFVQSSVVGLRLIAGVLLIAPWVIVPFAGHADATVVRSALKVDQLNSFTLFTGPFLIIMGLGLLIAAIAEAFAQGQRLQDDLDGLI